VKSAIYFANKDY